MQKPGSPAGAEVDTILGKNQPLLKHTDHNGRGMLLLPFFQVDRALAGSLTVSARNVQSSVLRDFGEERISGYQKKTSTTHGRIIRNSHVDGLEAYVAVVIDPYTKRRRDTIFAVGVATISLACPVPSGDTEMSTGETSLADIFGCEEDGATREGVVGTFWNGIPDFMTERAEKTFLQSFISTQIAGLLVPRMVEIAEHQNSTACSFVASERSGEPDTSARMRDYMRTRATGRWSDPVFSPDVEYDLLTA